MRCLLIVLLLPGMIAVADVMTGDYRAWIEQAYDSGTLVILPRLAAGHTARVYFELISIKSDEAGNTSSTRQAGSIQLEQGQVRTLSRMHLGINTGDHYNLKLRVFEGNQLVAEDRFTYPY